MSGNKKTAKGLLELKKHLIEEVSESIRKNNTAEFLVEDVQPVVAEKKVGLTVLKPSDPTYIEIEELTIEDDDKIVPYEERLAQKPAEESPRVITNIEEASGEVEDIIETAPVESIADESLDYSSVTEVDNLIETEELVGEKDAQNLKSNVEQTIEVEVSEDAVEIPVAQSVLENEEASLSSKPVLEKVSESKGDEPHKTPLVTQNIRLTIPKDEEVIQYPVLPDPPGFASIPMETITLDESDYYIEEEVITEESEGMSEEDSLVSTDSVSQAPEQEKGVSSEVEETITENPTVAPIAVEAENTVVETLPCVETEEITQAPVELQETLPVEIAEDNSYAEEVPVGIVVEEVESLEPIEPVEAATPDVPITETVGVVEVNEDITLTDATDDDECLEEIRINGKCREIVYDENMIVTIEEGESYQSENPNTASSYGSARQAVEFTENIVLDVMESEDSVSLSGDSSESITFSEESTISSSIESDVNNVVLMEDERDFDDTPEIKKIVGLWKIVEHRVEDEDFLDNFIRTRLSDYQIRDVVYDVSYLFEENGNCVKDMQITANIVDDAETLPYVYNVKLNISFKIKKYQTMEVIMESGRMFYSVHNQPQASKDYERTGQVDRIYYRFEGDYLILEDKNDKDIKKLRRVSAGEDE